MRFMQRHARSVGELACLKVILAIGVVLVLAGPLAGSAQTLAVLHEFRSEDPQDGWGPLDYGVLSQGNDGFFYGTTYGGGAYDRGTVFKMDAMGTITILHSFSGPPDGRNPESGLIQASDGAFYGTTFNGGTTGCGGSGCGTVYKITASGQYTQLAVFNDTDVPHGLQPLGGLIQGADGFFYGTTYGGGTQNRGTVFKMDSAGVVTTVHQFSPSEGWGPAASLIQASDGLLYGTTTFGGASDRGTVFSVDPSGALFSQLHEFGGTEGALPESALLEASDGHLYGTTKQGGSGDCVPSGSGCGTVFRIDRGGGNFLRLHSFNGSSEGESPRAALIQTSDGTFYGTTRAIGDFSGCAASGCGTIFSMNAAGVITILHTFSGVDGGRASGIIQATDGTFYGTTALGGSANYGVVYSLTIP